jgi:hypothetical protein
MPLQFDHQIDYVVACCVDIVKALSFGDESCGFVGKADDSCIVLLLKTYVAPAGTVTRRMRTNSLSRINWDPGVVV